MKRTLTLVSLLLFLFSSACGSETQPNPATDSGVDTGVDTGVDAVADDTGDRDGSLDTGDATDTSSGIPPRPWDLTERGPYSVGYVEQHITYEPRGQEGERTLRLAIWYPTQVTSGQEPRYYDIMEAEQVWEGAPVGVEDRMPLLVFSHGNSSMAEQSYFMTEYYATHGWVVASPDHTGNTLLDSGGEISLESAVFRPQDISAVIDHMVDLPAYHILAGHVDGDDIAMSGHSFGAVTALMLGGADIPVDTLEQKCEDGEIEEQRYCDMLSEPQYLDVFREGFLDDRIGVIMPQAPGGAEAFRQGVGAIATPTLMFTGGMDGTLPNSTEGDVLWDRMDGTQHLRINLPGAGHFTFSNMCDFLPDVEQFKNDGCGPEFMDWTVAYDIINAYTLAWSRYHLMDDPHAAPLVEGTQFPWEQVEMMRKSE